MKIKIPNDSHRLKEVSNQLIGALKDMKIEDSIIFDIHVAFEEALRNAMLHGNKMDPAKEVFVETELKDDSVIIRVEDEGAGFVPGELPDPTIDENILKESGRGVFMMRHLMSDVKYENSGRRVIMVKYFNAKHL